MFQNFVALLRPYQYSKNLFIFVPAFFAFQITSPSVLLQASTAFVAFSLIASSIYIINDWFDRKEDAMHPEKSSRPIASGRVSGMLAFVYIVGLFVLGSALANLISWHVWLLVCLYFLINIAYSLKLKHIAVIDVSIIALGFVMRLFVGAEATQIELSHWIIIMTFLLALFLSLAKRRDDVLIYLKTAQKMRRVIDGYNLKFLDAAMVMTASIVVLAYILWSISTAVVIRLGNDSLYLTAVFVLLGVLRYMQITFVEERSGNPSKILLKDRFVQLVLVGWVLSFVLILYIKLPS